VNQYLGIANAIVQLFLFHTSGVMPSPQPMQSEIAAKGKVSTMTLRDLQHNWSVFRAIRFVAIAFGLLLVAASSYAQTVIQKETATSLSNALLLDAMPQTAAAEIRPFHFKATDEQLADLRRRVAATKWPERETVSDARQGVQLATMQKLARYWATDYD
jgi:hypothetical protein